MEYYYLALFFTALPIGILTLYGILKRANGWYYSIKFCSKKYNIPPGDMGWPFIGNIDAHFETNISSDPNSFLSVLSQRFGPGGMYRGYIYGKPTIIVTKPDITRKILMDEENFDRGFPDFIKNLVGVTTSREEDKHFRRLTAPVKSHGLLSDYFDCIDRIVRTTLEKYAATEEPVKFLPMMTKLTFEVFMRILLGGEINQELFDEMFKGITCLNRGVYNLPIYLPGSSYYKAVKVRRKLVKIFQQILEERRNLMIAKDRKAMPRSNIIDMLLSDTNQDDYDGKRLSDKKIIEVILFFAFGGFDPVALMAIKAIMNLEKHPHFLEKAKKEQEDIVKRRSSSNVGLKFDEIKQMTTLNQVIAETLRLATNQTIFLKTTATIFNINGYTIPKGWMIYAVSWNAHMDPEIYVQPKEFNPSRWDNVQTKPGYFIPFSMGPRACPGSNFAKLQISVILHYLLLYYRVEQINPEEKTDPPENCLVKFKKLSASTDG